MYKIAKTHQTKCLRETDKEPWRAHLASVYNTWISVSEKQQDEYILYSENNVKNPSLELNISIHS